ncbi:MAG: hypothetical protein C0501_08665 [Isosphaera sp.]|nr:hypothetical protein [Isosphaera sp.]
MKAPVLFLAGAAVLLHVSAGRTQHKARPSDQIARDYNTDAMKLQDELYALRTKLNNPNLSSSEANAVVEEMSRLQKRADNSWAATQKEINESFSYKRQEMNAFNQETKKMAFESAVAGSRIDLLNNVGKYPEKAEFEKNKDALSKAWEQTYGSRLQPFGKEFAESRDAYFKSMKEKYGLDFEKDGYARIGTYNPYTGEVYYKYYGKDGKLEVLQWENDAKGWEKYREDSQTYWRRRRDEKEALEKDAAQLTKDGAAVKATQKTLSGTLTTLEIATKRVNFAGGWSGRDNLGNSVRLTLNPAGSMTYSFTERGRTYSSGGSWSQAGRQITARTSDGAWTLKSTITEEFKLEFDAIRGSDGETFRDYLNR